MLSLSRMRADARSLMMYWRRTCLNTGRNCAPSSVSKKGSFSHRSAGLRRSRLESTVHVGSPTKNRQPASLSTCPAFAKPGISVSQKLLDGAVPRQIELQKHPLQAEYRVNLRKARRSQKCVRGLEFQAVSLMYLFQSRVDVHLHLHDKQV